MNTIPSSSSSFFAFFAFFAFARSFAVAVVACVLFSIACSNPAKREAASLVEAVDRYRRAENVQKAAAAGDVRAASCTDAEVCATKTACIDAIDPTTRAFELKSEVERALADLEQKRLAATDPAARALPGKLDEAERLLVQGKTAMKVCEDKVLSLRMKYAI